MLKPISCFWLACFVFATLASLVISDSSNNDERANGNVEARRPKSREWLEQMKAEAQKHPSNHPTSLATRDIVSDIKARSFSLFSSSSSSSSSSEGKGFKKMMKRQRKMNKRARKHGGRYSPYGYNPQRFSGGYSGGRYPGAYPGGGGRFSGGYPGGGRFSGGYPGGNYGIGGNYGLGGGGGFSAIPAY